MASLARTFTPDESEGLVQELGEEKSLKLSVLIHELGKSRLKAILEEDTRYFTSDVISRINLLSYPDQWVILFAAVAIRQ